MELPKHRFFAPPDAFTGVRVVLPEDEARHALRVLRLGPGERVAVVDGAGGTHVVVLDEAAAGRNSSHRCRIRVAAPHGRGSEGRLIGRILKGWAQ